MARSAQHGKGEPWRGLLAYWVTAAAFLILTLWAEPYIDRHLNLQAERNWLFEKLSASATNPAKAGQARLVILGDEEFWKGPLNHRLPTDRAYIARLVQALDEAGASVIALDLDLGSPEGGPPVPPGEYEKSDASRKYDDETVALLSAVAKVAKERKVVLANTMDGPDNGPFTLLNQVYNAYGFCSRLTGDGVWDNPGSSRVAIEPEARRNISCGYIDLMDDPRQIPPPARLVGQPQRLDSFPMAIVRARAPADAPSPKDPPLYGRYVEGDLIRNAAISIPASVVLANPAKAREVLQGWPVIVGGAWSQFGVNLGPRVDTHPTPIGEVSGVVLHENLVEAALAHRMLRGLDEGELKALEVLVSVAAAIFFAAFANFRAKLAACLAAIAGLFLVQWLVLGLFGFFFEAFAPVVALAIHTLVDRLIAGSEEEPVAPAIATWAWLKSKWPSGRGAGSRAAA